MLVQELMSFSDAVRAACSCCCKPLLLLLLLLLLEDKPDSERCKGGLRRYTTQYA